MKTLQDLEKQLADIQKEVEALKQGKPNMAALLEEAIKKYPIGCKFKSAHSDYQYEVIRGITLCSLYPNCVYAVGANGEPHGVIYDGDIDKWATIIKEQPLMIGEYPVKSAIEGVTINHTFYPESSIFKIKKALEVSNVKSVNVGCIGQYKVDLEMINKIIKLIK
ncbi:MAG: hypothetical protein WC055_01935 [Melioribacteraceae bacterium]